ncbi:MAG: MATE family efflux transporter [Clostridia bacterium]|nr:MATE family efflux transporter [Clostridia bacterium]
MEKLTKEKTDFTSGRVLKKLILFSIPMALATLLQVLFNAADIAIVGQFGGSQYQAAVGATSSTVHLIVNLFIGISIGANVAMANAYGAKDETRKHKVVHSAMALSFTSGLIVLVAGLFLAKPILTAIDTPSEIIDYSTVYMQIYFLGAPAMMVYNFGAALMRGVGETRKPLYYLFVSGVLNVVINAATVIFFHWHVIGVALGTTLSQYVAAVWIVFDLRREKYGIGYSIRKTRFYKTQTKKILGIGIPMGLSSCFFSLSNLLVQSSVNAYGQTAIAGNTVASNIDTVCDAFASSVEKSVVTFVGQNMGAKKPERVHRIVGAGLFVCAAIQGFYGGLCTLFGKYICMIYNSDPAVIEWAIKRMSVLAAMQCLMSLMYSYGAALRGMGYSFFPMLINLLFTCVVRVIYLTFIYPYLPTRTILLVYIVYPVTWILSGAMQILAFYIVMHKKGYLGKRKKREIAAE